jgi:hypothetical protein
MNDFVNNCQFGEHLVRASLNRLHHCAYHGGIYFAGRLASDPLSECHQFLQRHAVPAATARVLVSFL